MRHRLTDEGRLRCLLARHRELIWHYRAAGNAGLANEHAVCAHLVIEQLWLLGQGKVRRGT